MLEIAGRASDVQQRGVERVMPHNLRQPVERDVGGHAVAEAVPEVMRTKVSDLRQCRILGDQIAQPARSERRPRLCRREEGCLRVARLCQRVCECCPCCGVERHLAILIPLAVDPQYATAFAQGHIAPAQPTDFPSAQAASWTTIGWWRAYVVVESCDDLVIEWKVPASITYRATGNNPDARRVISGGLWTRQTVNGTAIVRLTAGGQARAGTQYAGCPMYSGDAARLANAITFQIYI